MGRGLRWSYLILKSLRDDGFGSTVKMCVNRIIRKGERQDHVLSSPDVVVHDVLFVNGCPPEQEPHPYRYRVLHQKEQLRAAGYTVSEIDARACTERSVLSGNVIVFYRCPYSEQIGAAIRLAKSMNKRVLFDVDDLIIDTKYTDQIPAVRRMNRKDRALYDEGVNRYGATLRMCDGATTTTPRLREEMQKYVPKVWINRNCASERMAELSEAAWRKREKNAAERDGEVLIGYFSGTLTHNADFEMIKSALLRVMDENPQVKLLLMGRLDLPEELKAYGDRIVQKPFADWETLPEIIAGVDLNLAPVEDSIFNEAKSENKWVEAALVKVPTAASDVGAFREMIRDGETGYLVREDGWYETMTRAVRNGEERRRIAENAYQYCRAHCVTTENTRHVREIYEEARAPHAAFVLPSAEISGGIMVALRHACFLQDAGWNVDIIAHYAKSQVWEEFGHTFSCISYGDGAYENHSYYDLMVATMWTTVDYIEHYPRVGRKAYLVQNFEKDFYQYNNPERLDCEATYLLGKDWQYLTISEWCAGWLKEKYGQEAGLMKNGLEPERFRDPERTWPAGPASRSAEGAEELPPETRKVRILIEGDCAVDYKNVDESFRIAEKLDPERYEIWYMSYNAQPKEGYRVDKFLHAVPYDEVPQVYRACDVLLKSSWLESFSYPPLEMMAAGGQVVVVQNGGNSEYLRDGENCLTYPLGDEAAAAEAIRRICGDADLRERLREGGMRTAEEHDWGKLRDQIAEQYEKTLRE